MAKAVVTDPEELQPETLPKGTYVGTIEDCAEAIKDWGEVPEVQRFTWTVVLGENPDVEIADGKTLRETTPCTSDKRVFGRTKFLKFITGLGYDLQTFDSDEVIGKPVQVTVSEYMNKRSQERENSIDNMVLLEGA